MPCLYSWRDSLAPAPGACVGIIGGDLMTATQGCPFSPGQLEVMRGLYDCPLPCTLHIPRWRYRRTMSEQRPSRPGPGEKIEAPGVADARIVVRAGLASFKVEPDWVVIYPNAEGRAAFDLVSRRGCVDE